jgi:thiosulfate dehydrogenase [quinone] large subunit
VATTAEASIDAGEAIASRPPVDPVSRWAMALVRVFLGLVWLQKAGERMPPNFRSFLRTASGAAKTAGDPRTWLLSHVLGPNREFIGWVLLIAEIALAVCLLLGLLTRLAAAVGVADAILAGVFIAGAPRVSGWAYFALAAAHVAVIAGAAGRTFGIDGLLRPGWVATRARSLLRWS